MTYIEYISTTLIPFGVESPIIDLIILNQGLEPNKTIQDENDIMLAKKAMFKEFGVYIPKSKNITEGGYSITWDMEAIKLWYSSLAKDLGENDNITECAIINSKKMW